MNELDDLIAQKKAIEKRINELKNQTKHSGCAKWEHRHMPRGWEWTLSIARHSDYNNGRYFPAIERSDLNQAKRELKEIIADLTNLAEVLGVEI